MTRHGRRLALTAVVLASTIVTTVVVEVGARAEDDTLTNEDVVRRFVMGTPEAELIQRINRSHVAFDVSAEMLEELKLAGIPPDLLRAMLERQAAQDAASDPGTAAQAAPEPVADDRSEPILTVLLAPDANGEEEVRTLRVIDVPAPELIEQLRIRDPGARTTDIAIFLGCRTADHVPDQWRSKTPLGRDFNATPRHRVLQFVGGATAVAAGKLARGVAVAAGAPAPAILELSVPESLATTLDADVVHDLILGVAFEIGGRYYLLAQDTRDGVLLELGATGGTLAASISTSAQLLESLPTVRFE